MMSNLTVGITTVSSKIFSMCHPLFTGPTARNKPAETPSAKVTIFRNTNTLLPLKPFCNFQGVIL